MTSRSKDQARLLTQWAAVHAPGAVTRAFGDAATSGASLFGRPGVQALLRAVRAHELDVVVAESLDRLSRSQADIAAIYERLMFAGVRLVTLAEGDITELHIGLKGTMNALFLKDLAFKTSRGLRGCLERGRSPGGRRYGYHSVNGEPGALVIDAEEAAVVRRIFRLFVAGLSPKAIAKTLNAEGIPGPRGTWSPSTIHGHARLGTGILNNMLFIGQRTFGRQRFVKDPETGKRVARPNAQWETKAVPELRLIEDDLWEAAKARQTTTRAAIQQGIVSARRPIHLFSKLTKCRQCGGGFTLRRWETLRCFNHVVRGTCANTRAISRVELETRVLRALQERFFAPGVFDEFCRAFTEEMNRLRREHRVTLAAAPREIASLDRRSKEILELLLQGFRDEAWKEELRRLEARRTELQAAAGHGGDRAGVAGVASGHGRGLSAEDAAVRGGVRPRRRGVARIGAAGGAWLHRADCDSAWRCAATGGGESRGNVESRRRPEWRGGCCLMLVAGAGFEPATFGL